MSTKSSTWLTLLDRANRTKNGTVIDTVEALKRSNPIIGILPFTPANQITSHIYNKRTALPTIDWLTVGEGRSFAKSSTTPYTEVLGFAGKLSRVPHDLVKMCANMQEAMALRASEDMAFVEACGQEMASTFFYSSIATAPKKINGIATRRNSLSATDDMGKKITLDNGGTGSDLTSLYVIEIGPTTFHGIIPPNFPAGVEVTDKGKIFMADPDDSTKFLDFWVTEFGFAMGIVERNNRALRRVANIETSGSSNLINPDLLIEAVNDLPMKGQNAVILCNSTVLTQMEIYNKDYIKDVSMFGQALTAFRGRVPFIVCDAILNTETAVA